MLPPGIFALIVNNNTLLATSLITSGVTLVNNRTTLFSSFNVSGSRALSDNTTWSQSLNKIVLTEQHIAYMLKRLHVNYRVFITNNSTPGGQLNL